ncbi:MAG: sugar kinase [Ketobacter sp.]|nr:sugar kinase [Ketobacter sp.]
MSKDRKVVLVTRRTRMQELIAQYNTEGQAAFVIESRGQDFHDYREENNTYLNAVTEVEAELQRSARVQKLEREFLPNFIFGPEDIVVVVGQDGLVANTLKYLNGQPVIAVNPDPKRFDGVLLPFEVTDMSAIFSDVSRQAYQSKQITMAKATLNDGQELIAVNDLFIGPRYQISARYALTVDGRMEEQSSSGIIVSTGLGSTGWLKSVIAGAMGVAGRPNTNREPMPWDADYLTFAVREPFPSQSTGTELVFGEVRRQSEMRIASHMAGNGVIFSDGMVDDFLEFNSGVEVRLGLSERRGVLVV